MNRPRTDGSFGISSPRALRTHEQGGQLLVATDGAVRVYRQGGGVVLTGAIVTSDGCWYAWRRQVAYHAARQACLLAEAWSVVLAARQLRDCPEAVILSDCSGLVQRWSTRSTETVLAPEWMPRGTHLPKVPAGTTTPVRWVPRTHPLLACADALARAMKSTRRPDIVRVRREFTAAAEHTVSVLRAEYPSGGAVA